MAAKVTMVMFHLGGVGAVRSGSANQVLTPNLPRMTNGLGQYVGPV